jgi:hypothetical protein
MFEKGGQIPFFVATDRHRADSYFGALARTHNENLCIRNGGKDDFISKGSQKNTC